MTAPKATYSGRKKKANVTHAWHLFAEALRSGVRRDRWALVKEYVSEYSAAEWRAWGGHPLAKHQRRFAGFDVLAVSDTSTASVPDDLNSFATHPSTEILT